MYIQYFNTGDTMVTSAVKAELIENIIRLAEQSQKNGTEANKEVHNLLLQDTTSGKLYKYRSFDKKGYALKNLKNGTLFCAKPSSFNDPFDCKIGVTFSSFYQTQYNQEFDIITDVLQKFILIVHGQLDIESCDETEKRIIEELRTNERIYEFVLSDYACAKTEQEIADKLYENAFVIEEMLNVFVQDEELSASLGICSKMFPKITENITPDGMLHISKDNTSLEDFARANGVYDDSDDIGLTLRLSEQINPELRDARISSDDYFNKFQQSLNNRIDSTFLVGCLCTNYKNRLMWSHYADGHHGFCIEYDYSELNELTSNALPLPVVYSPKRPLIPWEAALDNSAENVRQATAQITSGLLVKDIAWAYENEWRILIDAKQNPNIKMPKITCIYLGVNISQTNRNKILKLAKQLSIPVKQMKVDRGEYDLHAENL